MTFEGSFQTKLFYYSMTSWVVLEELQCNPGTQHFHREFVPISQTQSASLNSASSQGGAGCVLWNAHQYMVISRDIWKFASEMHF